MIPYLQKIAEHPAWPGRTAWVFALRTNAAALFALMVAFALNLQQPQWAMMTVFIVSQPIAGMVISKGLFRLAGTLIGALAAVAITAATGDTQWLFVASIALWVALCTFAASMLRNPESYGAALAGYTAVIIALPAFGQSHLLIEVAYARCTEIMLGIVCAGIASRFFQPQLARTALVEGLENCIADLARYTSDAIAGSDSGQLKTAHRKLIADTQALAAMRAHARLEAPSLVTHGRHSRHTVGHLMSCLSIVNILVAHRTSSDETWRNLRDKLGRLLDAMANDFKLGASGNWLGELDVIGEEIVELKNKPWGDDRIGMMARLTLLGEFIDGFKATLNGLSALQSRSQYIAGGRKAPALPVYRDHNTALVNAIRAIVATTLMTAYWMQTKHTDAAAAAIIVAVVCSLFASMPNPLQTSWGFFRGTLYAVPFAFVLSQLILPYFPGLFWFSIFIVPVLVPAAILMADPRYVGPATAFSINFIVFLKPHETMAFAPSIFIETSLSVLIGVLIGILVFIVVLPKRTQVTVNRMIGALRTDIVRLCLRDRVPNASAFNSLAYDRINQLMPILRTMRGAGETVLDDALSSVTLGAEIIRLRRLLLWGRLDHGIADHVSENLAQLARTISLQTRDPGLIAEYVASARSVAAGIPPVSANALALQAAASLRLIAVMIEDHPSLALGTKPSEGKRDFLQWPSF
ncbi:FUSC family protein [Phyllobacterium myrsinacearum]|uniref:Putative membrane protein YccC n=1 Tax=Phyllobacterium myrsinacearum TaxID=28101 RepID=A0A839EPJ5_9HYPH|nr:FUSC family protein [Phyllobacterium myrsinacearum]MBA8879414.1 putative membrane protein YccC [Phyllobacterium myrsinacearum]